MKSRDTPDFATNVKISLTQGTFIVDVSSHRLSMEAMSVTLENEVSVSLCFQK